MYHVSIHFFVFVCSSVCLFFGVFVSSLLRLFVLLFVCLLVCVFVWLLVCLFGRLAGWLAGCCFQCVSAAPEPSQPQDQHSEGVEKEESCYDMELANDAFRLLTAMCFFALAAVVAAYGLQVTANGGLSCFLVLLLWLLSLLLIFSLLQNTIYEIPMYIRNTAHGVYSTKNYLQNIIHEVYSTKYNIRNVVLGMQSVKCNVWNAMYEM